MPFAPHTTETVPEITTRICTKCAEEKTLDQFHHSWCRVCWFAYLALRRKKLRKNQLRSQFFAVGRSRSLKECEKLCKAMIQRFGGLDRIGNELADCLKNRNANSPSGFKWMTSLMRLMDFAGEAERVRDVEYLEALSQLTPGETVEAGIDPGLMEMADAGTLVPVLKRLVACRKLKVADLT